MNSINYYRTLQPDDVAGIQTLYGVGGGSSGVGSSDGLLENPSPDSFQSGIGVISGWVCSANRILVDIRRNGSQVAFLEPAYGTERLDTLDVCGDTNNRFGILFNWNRLGDGTYTIHVEVDGYRAKTRTSTFTVTTLDGEFPRGLSGRYLVKDFPYPGDSVVIGWDESLQNFTIQEKR